MSAPPELSVIRSMVFQKSLRLVFTWKLSSWNVLSKSKVNAVVGTWVVAENHPERNSCADSADSSPVES